MHRMSVLGTLKILKIGPPSFLSSEPEESKVDTVMFLFCSAFDFFLKYFKILFLPHLEQNSTLESCYN